jgi:hypothetical protein
LDLNQEDITDLNNLIMKLHPQSSAEINLADMKVVFKGSNGQEAQAFVYEMLIKLKEARLPTFF